MFNDKVEPRCKIEDVFSFNFENLKKFLSFLHQGDVELRTNIKNLNSKIFEIDNFKIRLEDAESKINLFEKKLKEVETTQYAHQHKLIELDARQISNMNHLLQHDGILNELCPKTKQIEDNIKNFNAISEENTKSIRRLYDSTEEIKLQQERGKFDQEKFRSSLEKKSKDTEEIQAKKFSEIFDEFSKINKKIQSTEDSLSKMVEITTRKFDNANNSDGGRGSALKITTSEVGGSNTRLNNNDIQNLLSNENNFNTVMSHINSILSQIDFLKDENNLRKDSIINLDKEKVEFEETLNNNIKNLRMQTYASNQHLDMEDFHRRDRPLDRRNSIKSYEQQTKILKDLLSNDDEEIMADNVEKINDNLKLVSQTINNRVTREDFERLNKIFKLEIEKINDKLTNQVRIIEGKLRQQPSNQLDRKNSMESKSDKVFLLQIQEQAARVSKEIIDQEISTINLSYKEKFIDCSNKIETLKTEIDKYFQSMLEIKKSLQQSQQPSDDIIRDTNYKLLELEVLTKNNKILIDEIMLIIEGDSNDSCAGNYIESKSNLGNISLRDTIKHLNFNLKVLTDRMEQIQSKQNNMNTEILTKVKKDLQYESGRILEDFKYDLRNSINKIQEQLKEKVDRLNLDEFGKKIDNKMLIEIGKKLDKNDLKKNNNLINKKIDTLENKISKTLVDTLIDLQNDEAPLIVKKSINGEKCASCNQYKQNSQQMHEMRLSTYENKNLTNSINNTRYRMTSMSNLEESEEEIKSVRVSQLPEINLSMSKTKSHFNLHPKKMK